jgi:hypothetical protein
MIDTCTTRIPIIIPTETTAPENLKQIIHNLAYTGKIKTGKYIPSKQQIPA